MSFKRNYIFLIANEVARQIFFVSKPRIFFMPLYVSVTVAQFMEGTVPPCVLPAIGEGTVRLYHVPLKGTVLPPACASDLKFSLVDLEKIEKTT